MSDSNEKIKEIIDFAKHNVKDTIAYSFLFLGILISLFNPSMGGILVGFVSGLYLSKEFMYLIRHYQDVIIAQGVFKSFVIAGMFLYILLIAPYLFFGIGLAIALKYFIISQENGL